jgi:hypothetical protein
VGMNVRDIDGRGEWVDGVLVFEGGIVHISNGWDAKSLIQPWVTTDLFFNYKGIVPGTRIIAAGFRRRNGKYVMKHTNYVMPEANQLTFQFRGGSWTREAEKA